MRKELGHSAKVPNNTSITSTDSLACQTDSRPSPRKLPDARQPASARPAIVAIRKKASQRRLSTRGVWLRMRASVPYLVMRLRAYP
jgi:hypothetical protein